MNDANAALVVLLIAACVVSNLYSFFYWFRPWRSTPQGRALMVKSLANSTLLNLGVAFQLFGDYPGRLQIRLVAFTLFVVGVTYLFTTLMTAPGAKDYPPWTWFRRYM